ncbi:MAG: DUF1365 domain-containing protein [Phenylobacterium sp.]
MTQGSFLYRGAVMHQRRRPKPHRLSYRVFWLLLDLAEIDDLDRQLRLFSRGRTNLLSFHDRDYGDGSGASLRPQVEDWLRRADIDIGAGPIRLLTMPRVLGYVFNPISLYYCHEIDGRLAAVIYEVTSTFGERRAYVIPLPVEDQQAGRIRQGAAKALYVSPFLSMDMAYEFRGHAPGARLDLAITGLDAEGPLITAVMSGERRPLEDRDLLVAAVAVPLLTLKVIAAIHWEALKLWLKGAPLTRRPPTVGAPVAVPPQARESRLGR